MLIERQHTELTPYHLFYGLLENPQTFISQKKIKFIADIKKQLNNLPTTKQPISFDQVRPSANLSKWISMANANAIKDQRSEILEKDLLKHITKILPEMNIKAEDLLSDDKNAEVPDFLINLNIKAIEGKLDPVIGRTKEIRRVLEILGRRSKNNPILVGPPGVGKTAIVEGIAEAIVKGNVPDILKDKIIFNLEIGMLMAGTKYRGEFEKKIQNLLKFAKDGSGQYIIFVDEIHQLIGAGKTDGAMDGANLLKPALSRGEIHCIGATTDAEFQQYFMNDQALERRFRKVSVHEPSKEDSIEIIQGLRDKFESHHGIKIADDAIYSAVMLSSQYIGDKYLPDKAIDLIDEGASSLRLSAQSMPPELENLKAEIRSKEILQEFKPTDDLNDEIKQLKKKFDVDYSNWEKEVTNLHKTAELKSSLERLKTNLDKAEREQRYEEASRIKYSLIPEIETKLAETQEDWILNKNDIAKVISKHTGIPASKIMQEKTIEILELEEKLNRRIFGQKESIHEICETLLCSYAGLTSPFRPLGSFLLKGPTGVGKTETAKGLATNLFNQEENIIRLDMSEYSQKHAVSNLIGAPAGYVGYDAGGVLTEAVRKKPYSVVLFDEIEKAHTDFSDILLQILDEGRLTDNKGRTVSFRNTVIILTTNSKNIELDFKPEVLGRLDSVLEFHSLGKEVMQELVKKQISLLGERLQDKKITLKFTQKLIEELSRRGYDPTYGARPLNAVFNKSITRPLSRTLVQGNLENSTLEASIDDCGEIKFNKLS
jgi:ATP-dependent Clp protease ATP-binding subunit ClpB